MKKILYVTLILGLWTMDCFATTWYVKQVGGNDGNNCTLSQSPSSAKATITSAMACISTTPGAGAGHTVEVWAGTYNERLFTWPSGTSFAAPFTLQAHTGDIVTIFPSPPSSNSRVLYFSNTAADYIVVSGFVLDGSQTDAEVVSVFGGDHIVVGTSYLIGWTTNDPGNVKVELSNDSGTTYPVNLSASVLGSIGQLSWTPTAPLFATVRIKVTSLDYPSVSDASNADIVIHGNYVK